MKKLIIIDGNAILYRAYHALPSSLKTVQGQPVNAIYGFFSMLLKVIEEQKPEYFVVCFDRSSPTVRQEMFVGYHAHRPKMDDDLVSQMRKVDEIVEKMHAAMFAVNGFEADDLIGTIAKEVQEGKEDIETIIVTGDRDLLQLVDKKTKVMMLVTGLSKTLLFDEKAVEEKYGVTPAQFIDYKALIGDASDGYPGVAGIGPKTAATLLQKYKTFENLYEHVGELSEKQGLQLATDAEQAALAKKLATIIRDVPFQFDVKKCASTDFDIAALQQEFIKLGSNSLQKRLAITFPDYAEKKKKKIPDGQIGLL
jgi:DNA polymerase-1